MQTNQDVVRQILDSELKTKERVSKFYVIELIKSKVHATKLRNIVLTWPGGDTNDPIKNVNTGANKFFRDAWRHLKEKEFKMDKDGWITYRKTMLKSKKYTIHSLILAGLVHTGDKIYFKYKDHNFEGTIKADGQIEVLGQICASLSKAAMHAISVAYPEQKFPNTNGWVAWQTKDSVSLSEIRTRLKKS